MSNVIPRSFFDHAVLQNRHIMALVLDGSTEYRAHLRLFFANVFKLASSRLTLLYAWFLY